MALTATQSCAVGIEPFQVGDQVKLKVTVSYTDPTDTEVDQVLFLQPQGLWNGLAPLIYKLQSGSLPGWQLGTPPEGPQPQFDLTRLPGGAPLPVEPYLDAPPPTVAWPYSRRTWVQHQVDAGTLDESGQLIPGATPA